MNKKLEARYGCSLQRYPPMKAKAGLFEGN